MHLQSVYTTGKEENTPKGASAEIAQDPPPNQFVANQAAPRGVSSARRRPAADQTGPPQRVQNPETPLPGAIFARVQTQCCHCCSIVLAAGAG
jgi:hypothetical protein